MSCVVLSEITGFYFISLNLHDDAAYIVNLSTQSIFVSLYLVLTRLDGVRSFGGFDETYFTRLIGDLWFVCCDSELE